MSSIRSLRSIAAIASVVASAAFAPAAFAQKPGPSTWQVPACQRIIGTGAVTFTADEGATLTPTVRRLTGTGYTMGLAALDTPNQLLAVFNRTLLRSADAGCRWTSGGTIATVSDGFPMTLAAARGGFAYGWSDNRPDLVRIDAAGIAYLKSPASEIAGLGVDPADGNHLRLGGGDGQLWESRDAGASWSPIGVPAVAGPLLILYRAAFDPSNLDHVLVGTATTGAFVTFDGGATWTQATGFSTGSANVFNLVVSPVDARTVWAMGIDLVENLAGVPSEGRHIYLSHDGGATFAPVVDRSATVTLINGPVMAASPADAGVLYFVFGTSFGNYGTDLFRYDAGTNALTMTHNAYDDISSIAFNPADATVLYLGLATESIN